MKAKLTILAVAVLTVLAVGTGVAVAGPWDSSSASHDRMHSSEQMRAMHDQMPADAQAECDAMPAEMGDMGRMHGRPGMAAMHRQSGGMGDTDEMHRRAGMDAMHGQAWED